MKKEQQTFQIKNVRIPQRKRKANGTWPLGLSNEVVREYNIVGGIEEFENQKQIEVVLNNDG